MNKNLTNSQFKLSGSKQYDKKGNPNPNPCTTYNY